MNKNYGCFVFQILPPTGGVPFLVWIEVNKDTEVADIIAGLAKVRKVLVNCVHAGDPKPADVAYNTFGE